MLTAKILSQVGLILVIVVLGFAKAKAEDCYDGTIDCDKSWLRGGKGTRATSSSATGGKIKLNPAAVPTEKGFGIESIYFKTTPDFGVARGTGRIGAAISPSNSDETFFGPPAVETESDLYERKLDRKKYPGQKVTLGAAISLAEKKSSAFKSYAFRAGFMGKYNTLTHEVNPGFGVSGSLGPISWGGSIYNDQSVLNPDFEKLGEAASVVRYQVRTYNVGLFLSSLVIDYSHLSMDTEEPKIEMKTFTASLFLKGFILTGAQRIETSSRKTYNSSTKTLDVQTIKNDTFYGLQYAVTKNIMIGGLYNYYLLNEYAATATVFF